MTTLPEGWSLTHTLNLPSRDRESVDWTDLSLSEATNSFLRSAAPDGVWKHQHKAIAASVRGEDVCLATSTASGKTLAFHAAAIERLSANPRARVLAIYPMKALGHEQQERWERALAAAGIAGSVRSGSTAP